MTLFPNIQDGNMKKFAIACVETNTDAELMEGMVDICKDDNHYDAADCKAWDISPEEWRQAISLAAEQKYTDRQIDIYDCPGDGGHG